MQKIKAHKQAFRRALRILYWVGLMILYLCAASRPGVWLRDAFLYRQTDRKSTRLNSSHRSLSRMPSSA